MATILVDYENVFTIDGLKGAEYLKENDTLVIFYSQSCEKIRAEYIDMIENALLSLNAPEDVTRRRLIHEKVRSLNIDSEQARIKEHREFVNKIIRTFEGTEYEEKTDNILKFIEKQDMKTPRILYTGSLHEFGREDGRAIYQILKQVV